MKYFKNKKIKQNFGVINLNIKRGLWNYVKWLVIRSWVLQAINVEQNRVREATDFGQGAGLGFDDSGVSEMLVMQVSEMLLHADLGNVSASGCILAFWGLNRENLGGGFYGDQEISEYNIFQDVLEQKQNGSWGYWNSEDVLIKDGYIKEVYIK